MRLPSIKIAVFMFVLALVFGVALARCQESTYTKIGSQKANEAYQKAYDVAEARLRQDKIDVKDAAEFLKIAQDQQKETPSLPPKSDVQTGNAAAQAKSEAKDIPLPDADVDKFLLAAERKAHADTRVQAAWSAWVTGNPEVLRLYQDQQTYAKALDTVAGELLKKAGLDAAKYQLDADGAGKPPHPKYVLRKP